MTNIRPDERERGIGMGKRTADAMLELFSQKQCCSCSDFLKIIQYVSENHSKLKSLFRDFK